MGNAQKILHLLHEFERMGLIEQDSDKILALFTDQLIGVGMGEQGIAFSKADVQKIINAGIRKPMPSTTYQLAYSDEAINMTSDKTANACAIVTVNKTEGTTTTHSSFVQLLSVVLQDEQWKICAMSATPIVFSSESIDAYPLAFADRTLAQLRAEVKSAMEEKNKLLEAQALELSAQNEEMCAQNEQLIAQQDALTDQAQALAVSEERFRIALEKTNNIIFDYDLGRHVLRYSTPGQRDQVLHITNENLSKLPGGTIVANDQELLRQAFEVIRAGADQSSCIIRVIGKAGDERWNRFSMTAIRDAFEDTVRAVGMIEDITKQKLAELAYAREEQYRQAILGSVMASYVINFTLDQVEDCQIRDPRCLWIAVGDSYEKHLLKVARTQLRGEQYTVFVRTFSTVSIISAFAHGQDEIRLDYLATDFGGGPLWLQNTMRLVVDAATGEKKGYLYVNDIDEQKHEELTLIRKAEQDALTGIFNNSAIRLHVGQRLESPDCLETGVFMMLDIDHFKSINDTYGHPFGDEVLVNAAKALSNSFRGTDIVGRLGGDEFCVFFCGIHTRARIAEAARTICRHIHAIEAPDGTPGHFTCSLGIALCDGAHKSFADLYREADAALYQVKDAGRDGFAFYGEVGRVSTER